MSELASALGGRFLHPFTNNLALESNFISCLGMKLQLVDNCELCTFEHILLPIIRGAI